jgi:DNA mismatch repair protein MutS
MCGVPIERADDYLHKLIALGHRVAVCEQLEDPAEAKKRSNKSVVRRDVVRLVTPGTLTEDTLLDAKRNNYLLAIARARGSSEESRFGLATLDISTGEFRITECEGINLGAEIARLEPSEVLVSDALYSDPELTPLLRSLPAVTPLAREVFDGATAERRLASYFAVATTEAFGALTRLEATAAAACITYVERTQIGERPPLSPPQREARGSAMAIDAATRTNLELMRTLAGDQRGSVLAAIDRTATAAGFRLLAQRLASPLTDSGAIAERLDAIEAFCADTMLRNDVQKRLAAAPDIARALARLAVGRGGPRDLAAIRLRRRRCRNVLNS